MNSWQYTDATNRIVAMIDADGRQISMLADAPEIVAWVAAGNVIADAPGATWTSLQEKARAALEASDVTILRCTENGVTGPAEWAAYRKALRAIVSAATGDPTQPLPSRPAYPAGT